MNKEIRDKIKELTLEEKVRLISGMHMWATHPAPKVGLDSIMVSDGPSGVRGPEWDERKSSLSLPSASAVASTWNVDLVDQSGAVMAHEARRKGVDVVLGPTINLHRSPVGGRHFEQYSEDPILSGHLASAFVKGVQRNGVSGCLKHYVGNDAETNRFTVNSVIDEKTLREVYALPFEIAVRDSHPWTIMSSYNRVNGESMSESKLLNEMVKEEWQWDGMIVSDWTAVRTTIAAAKHGNDLAMPGPNEHWDEKLVAAVRSGAVPEEAIDAKVERIMLLAQRVGRMAMHKAIPNKTFTATETKSFARALESEGIVLAKNNGALPLKPSMKVGIYGQHAQFPREQGGGSATVFPDSVSTPLAAITSIASSVEYQLGALGGNNLIYFDKTTVKHPTTNEPGMLVEFINKEGKVIDSEHRYKASFLYSHTPWIRECARIKLTAKFTADRSGTYTFGVGLVGVYELRVGRYIDKSGNVKPLTDDLGEWVLNPPADKHQVVLQAGEEVLVEAIYHKGGLGDESQAAFNVGFLPAIKGVAEEIKAASESAKHVDVAIVFVGTNSAIESEGYDRENLSLPEGHDDLVEAVAANAKQTVVVVNAGSPVEMPWFNKVDAVILPWFGGEEIGNAIADVLYGKVNPSGHLPTTWATTMADVPVLNTHPTNGDLVYTEGVYMGYRAWHKSGKKPLLPFGFGLSYTTFSMKLLEASREVARVKISNTGSLDGATVAQIYVQPKGSGMEDRRLAGFVKQHLAAGQSVEVEIDIEPFALQKWEKGWVSAADSFTLTLAEHAFDSGESATI